jgi:hypothetical protein
MAGLDHLLFIKAKICWGFPPHTVVDHTRIMKKYLRTIVALALVIILAGNSKGEEETEKKPCKDHPLLSGPCYKVRGRMSFANGTPSLRIWLVGTKRILGISEGRFYLKEYSNVPEELIRQLTWDTFMCADFTVCPFTDDKPGVMRMGCVESAENIKIKKRK